MLANRRIAYIGRFERLDDEEYIARSFEALGHTVLRIPIETRLPRMWLLIQDFAPNLVLFTKFPMHTGGVAQPAKEEDCKAFIAHLKTRGVRTAAWVFDLYVGYGARDAQVAKLPFFTANNVFTTDGGHQAEFLEYDIRHRCVRQGIYRPEALLLPFEPATDPVVFVGSDNPNNVNRTVALKAVAARYGTRFHWYGKNDTHEVRGMALNELYSRSKVVIGDSVYSPYYWSNRVVETLGRGGFLIHENVPGLKDEYPDLVTYPAGDVGELMRLIDYYLAHEEERRAIVKKNFDLVVSRYTAEHKCAELLALL